MKKLLLTSILFFFFISSCDLQAPLTSSKTETEIIEEVEVAKTTETSGMMINTETETFQGAEPYSIGIYYFGNDINSESKTGWTNYFAGYWVKVNRPLDLCSTSFDKISTAEVETTDGNKYSAQIENPCFFYSVYSLIPNIANIGVSSETNVTYFSFRFEVPSTLIPSKIILNLDNTELEIFLPKNSTINNSLEAITNINSFDVFPKTIDINNRVSMQFSTFEIFQEENEAWGNPVRLRIPVVITNNDPTQDIIPSYVISAYDVNGYKWTEYDDNPTFGCLNNKCCDSFHNTTIGPLQSASGYLCMAWDNYNNPLSIIPDGFIFSIFNKEDLSQYYAFQLVNK
ncbi:MAG: hypothetical protein NTZ74_05120 [Chloroflexi bacterium]|nr:hypothetical protein [Chloroflexota bacterium]